MRLFSIVVIFGTGSGRARHSYLPEAVDEWGRFVENLGSSRAGGCNFENMTNRDQTNCDPRFSYQSSGEASREPCEYAEVHTDDLLQKCGAGYRAPGPSVTRPLVSSDPVCREGPAKQAAPYCSPGQ